MNKCRMHKELIKSFLPPKRNEIFRQNIETKKENYFDFFNNNWIIILILFKYIFYLSLAIVINLIEITSATMNVIFF